MPSITYWNRLEPRPRARSLADTLAARVRDPLWFLTRQWQFGEFRGEDAASPAFVRVGTTCMPMSAWRTDGPWLALDGSSPLEPLIESEPFDGADLSLQVELALEFEAALRAAAGMTAPRADAVLDELRNKLPLTPPPPEDPDAARFFAVCGTRAFDGVALHGAAAATPPALPAGVVIDPADLASVNAALAELVRWVRETLGQIGQADPPAWVEDRLEYALRVAAAAGGETVAEFSLHPELEGDIDWFTADPVPAGDDAPPAIEPLRTTESLLPTHVRFRGMPNARWWDFEDWRTDFGDIRPHRRDAGKLVVMDFMLVHGNDWFVVPLEQPVGSICRIDELSVRDVFGGVTHVPRADAADARGRWTLFSSATAAGDAPREFLVLPPSVAQARQVGEPLEDVRFFRDEMANMVWAVERTVPGGAGEPWPGHERSVALLGAAPPPTAGALSYLIQTSVPHNWIPFVPVSIDLARGEIALERAAMLDTSRSPAVPIRPIGRVLMPRGGAEPYRVREEEISRAGVRIQRVVNRSRWIDGSTWVWISRRRIAGGGEGWSGLQYDQAVGG